LDADIEAVKYLLGQPEPKTLPKSIRQDWRGNQKIASCIKACQLLEKLWAKS
jgi:hypothetical protein